MNETLHDYVSKIIACEQKLITLKNPDKTIAQDKAHIDNRDIFTKVVDDLGVPRPTVRRVARDLRFELLEKIKLLQSEIPNSPEHYKLSSEGKQKKSATAKDLHKEFEKVRNKLESVKKEISKSKLKDDEKKQIEELKKVIENFDYTTGYPSTSRHLLKKITSSSSQ